MAKTLHDRYCEGLEALGYTRIPSRNKYTMFTGHSPAGILRFFFVGASGSLRVSASKSTVTSRPCSKIYKDILLNEPTKKVV